MALKLIASYSKRLGLPEYSSHQFAVSIEAELTGADDIAGESARIYEMLQGSVDEQIQHTGFVPTRTYGSGTTKNGVNGHHSNGNGAWHCSDKQRDLILKFVAEQDIPMERIDSYALQLCRVKAKELSKVQASELIALLIEEYCGEPPKATRRLYQHSGKA